MMFNGGRIIPTEFWQNGPAPGAFYNFAGAALGQQAQSVSNAGKQHTTNPITTGTSVVGIKFDGGVMIASDNLVSYGSLARYQDIPRVFKINNHSILGASGDFADFQSLKRSIDQRVIEDNCFADGHDMKPKSLYNWLTRVLYNRRSRFNPLWLELVIGGMNDGVPFLGHVDLRGRAYEDNVVATGFGKHLALPIVREHTVDGKLLTQQQASVVLRKVMEVLYYRDCRAMSKYTVAVCTATGSVVEGPFNVDENWSLAELVKGF